MKVMLVVTYLSLPFGNVSIKQYEMPDMATCKSKGNLIHSSVKTGRVATNCWRVK